MRADIPLRGTIRDGQLWCSRCKTFQSQDSFYRNRTTKTGRDGVCKTCTNQRREETKVHRAIIRRAYRERNRERILRQKRESYHRNPEASTEASRQWRKNNPERVRIQTKTQNLARYTRLKNAPGKATTEQVQQRWDYYGGKCWMCGNPATDMDHVKPLAKGGSNWPANLRPACQRCNRAKSAKWPLTELDKAA